MNIIVEKEYSVLNKQYLINLNSHKTKNVNQLNIVCDALQIEKIKSIKEYFSFYSEINCNENYSMFMSYKNKKDYMDYFKNKIKTVQKYNNDYFEKVYIHRKDLLSKLKPVDNCDMPVYSHSSATGRSKIIKGTNFMTMKKEKRKKLSYNNNQMFEIDFNSCEPYFYLLANDKIDSSVVDVYSEIQDKLNIANKTRKQLKNAIISVLYGAQFNTVKRLSNFSKVEYSNLLNFLDITNFLAKLKTSIYNDGCIYNFYNRPVIVTSERLAVNYWVQSSVADFCYLSFGRFINDNKINFHAIIHDAIICSSNKNIANQIKNIKYLQCPVSNFKIPVSFLTF
jgi:hypothetical protein